MAEHATVSFMSVGRYRFFLGRVIATMTLSINRKGRVLPPFPAARPIKERLMAAPMSSR